MKRVLEVAAWWWRGPSGDVVLLLLERACLVGFCAVLALIAWWGWQ